MSDPTIDLPLTPSEREAIRSLPDLNPIISNRLQRADPADPAVRFTTSELDYLTAAAACEAARSASPGRQRLLAGICCRAALMAQWDARDRRTNVSPGLARLITRPMQSRIFTDLLASCEESSWPARYKPQLALDRMRVQILSIDWERPVPIFLKAEWKAVILGLPDLDPETRATIQAGGPNRRKFRLRVWEIHALRRALFTASWDGATDAAKRARDHMALRLLLLEMQYTGGLGPGLKFILAEEDLLAAGVRHRTERTARQIENAGQLPRRPGAHLKAGSAKS